MLHTTDCIIPDPFLQREATYYAGAYYLGHYRGGVHTWENFAVSGSVSGLGVALWMIRPIKLRPAAFGVLLGGLLGGAGAAAQQVGAAAMMYSDASMTQGARN